MNKEALERLAALIDKDQLIDMSLWQYTPVRKIKEYMMTGVDCGFVCCAIGHAAHDPWFNERGFAMHRAGTPVVLHNDKVTQTSWFAVTTFFRISHEEAQFLFSEESYKEYRDTMGADVAARIRDFIENKEAQDVETSDEG
jgi:hypothetical protein